MKISFFHSRAGGRRAARSFGGDLMNFILLAVFGLFMFIPMLFVINNAFKPLDELFVFPPRIFVRNPTLDNFSDLSLLMSESWVPFMRYVFNTVFITAVATAGHVVVASMGAYALEKKQFRGKKVYFKVIVSTLLFTGGVTAIPNFMIMTGLGLIDSPLSLIIPALGAPMGLYLMKQFMCNIPDTLIEAARIDGAGDWRTFWFIVMPNLKPAWLTLVIFSFQSLWGATGGTYILSEEKKTLSYALGQIVAGGVARTGAAAAVSVVMMIVPVSVFVISQSNILETMSTSGIKE